jgi:hypothetical protein
MGGIDMDNFGTIIIIALILIAAGWFFMSSLEGNYQNGYKKGLLSAACNTSLKVIDSKAFDEGYAKALIDTRDVTFQSGYSKAIADTQNATILLGYCAAQQEMVTSGVMALNNTVLVIPITTLKETCFR